MYIPYDRTLRWHDAIIVNMTILLLTRFGVLTFFGVLWFIMEYYGICTFCGFCANYVIEIVSR